VCTLRNEQTNGNDACRRRLELFGADAFEEDAGRIAARTGCLGLSSGEDVLLAGVPEGVQYP